MPRPYAAEYDAPFARYVERVPEEDALPVLAAQLAEVRQRFSAVPADRESSRYAPEKWSVRQVLGHMVDAERIFGTRALCIARGEQTSLPGFAEDAYVASAPFEGVTLARLLAEFDAVRAGNVLMLGNLASADWLRLGTVSGKPMSVRALAWILAGHVRHHLAVLAERYRF